MSEVEAQTLPLAHPLGGYVGVDPSPSDGAGASPQAEIDLATQRDALYEADTVRVEQYEDETAETIQEARLEPVQQLDALDPPSCSISGTELVLLRVLGSHFTETTQIWWHDHLEPTEFVSPNEVTTNVTPWLFLVPDYVEVGVQDNGVDGNRTLLFALLP